MTYVSVRPIIMSHSTYENVEPLILIDASIFGAVEELVELRE